MSALGQASESKNKDTVIRYAIPKLAAMQNGDLVDSEVFITTAEAQKMHNAGDVYCTKYTDNIIEKLPQIQCSENVTSWTC